MNAETSHQNPLLQLLSTSQRQTLFDQWQSDTSPRWFGRPKVDRMPVAMLRCNCRAVSELDPIEPSITYGLL